VVVLIYGTIRPIRKEVVVLRAVVYLDPAIGDTQ